MTKPAIRPLLTLLALGLCATLAAQPFQQTGPRPNLRDNIDHPLRYSPDGQDFVIENGGEFFNRPLYGGNTAFRVDAGDMPEFALYLPGRGGNLRLGILAAGGRAKWLHETARITARYRPGEMLYEIRDPLLGENATLRIHAIALHQTDGLIVRVDTAGFPSATTGLQLLAAYGGANGKRGKRDGDIGTESVPISEYFQLQPEACRDNIITLDGAPGRFTLRSAAAKAALAGQFPATARLALADASAWRNAGFQPATAPAAPILVSATPLAANTPLYFCIQRLQDAAAAPADELDDYKAVTAPSKDAPVSAPAQPATRNPKSNRPASRKSSPHLPRTSPRSATKSLSRRPTPSSTPPSPRSTSAPTPSGTSRKAPSCTA